MTQHVDTSRKDKDMHQKGVVSVSDAKVKHIQKEIRNCVNNQEQNRDILAGITKSVLMIQYRQARQMRRESTSTRTHIMGSYFEK